MKIYSLLAAAELLVISRSKLYHMVEMGEITHFRVGRQIRFTEEMLQEWIDTQTIPAQVAS